MQVLKGGLSYHTYIVYVRNPTPKLQGSRYYSTKLKMYWVSEEGEKQKEKKNYKI